MSIKSVKICSTMIKSSHTLAMVTFLTLLDISLERMPQSDKSKILYDKYSRDFCPVGNASKEGSPNNKSVHPVLEQIRSYLQLCGLVLKWSPRSLVPNKFLPLNIYFLRQKFWTKIFRKVFISALISSNDSSQASGKSQANWLSLAHIDPCFFKSVEL